MLIMKTDTNGQRRCLLILLRQDIFHQIEQKTTSKNPRSTVGTITEIYDYLRLLYARIGIPHCPKCGKVISKQSVDQIVDQVMALGDKTKIQILAPIIRGKKGTHERVLDNIKKNGYVRARVDGEIY